MARADWVGFVNVRLDSHHKDEVKKRAGKMTEKALLESLEQLVADGYGVSLSPDDENGAVVCTLTGKDPDCANAGYSMSQRHSDPRIAFAAALFVHYELAESAATTWEDVAASTDYDW